MTFSEKAAGELKLRIREQLEQRRVRAKICTADEVGSGSAKAVHDFEDAHVSTIHGFCAELLRERPVEARVDPSFAVLTEIAGRSDLRRGVHRLAARAAREPGRGLRRSLRRPVALAARRGGGERADRAAEAGRARSRRVARSRRGVEAAVLRSPSRHRELVDELKDFAGDDGASAEEGRQLRTPTPSPPAASAPRSSGSVAARIGSERLRRLGSRAGHARPTTATSASPAKAPARALPTASLASRCTIGPRAAARRPRSKFRDDADADLAALLREELRDCLARYEAAQARSRARSTFSIC